MMKLKGYKLNRKNIFWSDTDSLSIYYCCFQRGQTGILKYFKVTENSNPKKVDEEVKGKVKGKQLITRSRENNFYERKIVIIPYQSIETCVLGAQKNRLIETVLLSIHNICFGPEQKKIVFQYILLSGGLLSLSPLSF